MNPRKPPAVAKWLIRRLTCEHQDAALLGDLTEEFHSGRSNAWYWRRTFSVILAGLGRRIRISRRYLRAMFWGWSAQADLCLIMASAACELYIRPEL